MKVGDYIVSKFAAYTSPESGNLGKVIGIVTGFDQDEDPKYTVVYSTTGYGFGANLCDYKTNYKVIKDEQLLEVIHQWSTTPVVGEQGVFVKVGDLVRYTGKNRIGMKTGTIGYIKSKHIGNTLDFCIVTILTTGKERRMLERDLDVYEPRNQTESR